MNFSMVQSSCSHCYQDSESVSLIYCALLSINFIHNWIYYDSINNCNILLSRSTHLKEHLFFPQANQAKVLKYTMFRPFQVSYRPSGLPWWLSGICLPMQETQVPSLGQGDPPEKELATHPVFLLGISHRQRSLAGSSPWGCKRV